MSFFQKGLSFTTFSDLQPSCWPALSSSFTQCTCPLAHAMWRGGPKWTSYASSLAPLAIINLTTSTLPEKNVKFYWQWRGLLGYDWLNAAEGLPRMQASWSGEAVRAVRDGFTLAPYSKSSLAHSRLPEEHALHRGVLPWMVRTSTWNNHRNYLHYISSIQL